MKKILSTKNAPSAIGPYSQAVEAGGVLYISGQLPINPANGQIPPTIEEQTVQCLKNIYAILCQADLEKENVVKCTVLLDDIKNFDAMNKIYGEFFTKDYPARVAYQVAKLPKGAMIEIETIAVR